MLGLRSMYLVLFIIFAHTMPRVTSDSLPLSCLFLSPVYPPLRQCPNRETFKKKKKKKHKGEHIILGRTFLLDFTWSGDG